MILKEISTDELEIIKDWYGRDSIEFQTCRPIVNNKPAVRINDVTNLLFYVEGMTEPAGNIFYFDVNERNRSCEFGYKVNPDFRNKGLGKLMLINFISHMFGNKNFNKLFCQTAEFNKPSVKMLERIGLKKDGTLREHHELNGKLYDDYVYSILRSEWMLWNKNP